MADVKLGSLGNKVILAASDEFVYADMAADSSGGTGGNVRADSLPYWNGTHYRVALGGMQFGADANLGLTVGQIYNAAPANAVKAHIGVLDSGLGQIAGSIGYFPRSDAQAYHVFYNYTGAVDILINASGNIVPGADAQKNIGSPTFRFANFYGSTGAINTSDAREKTWLRTGLTNDEYAAGKAIIAKLGFFQWNDSIVENGAANAREHFGVEAQSVWAALSDAGLIPALPPNENDYDAAACTSKFGFLCFDEDADIPNGNRFGVRSDQINTLLIATLARQNVEQQAAIDDLISRVAALETA